MNKFLRKVIVGLLSISALTSIHAQAESNEVTGLQAGGYLVREGCASPP